MVNRILGLFNIQAKERKKVEAFPWIAESNKCVLALNLQKDSGYFVPLTWGCFGYVLLLFGGIDRPLWNESCVLCGVHELFRMQITPSDPELLFTAIGTLAYPRG